MWLLIGIYFLIGLLAVTFALNNIRIVRFLECKVTRGLIVIMMLLVIVKYVGYTLFGLDVAMSIREAFKRTWLLSSMGLVLPMVFTIRHLYKKVRLGALPFLIRLSPLIFFYIVFILKAGITIIPSPLCGSAVEISRPWVIGLSIVQGLSVLVMAYYTVVGMIVNKDIHGRIRLLVLLIPLTLFALEGISLLLSLPVFQPLALSELMALIGIGYGLSYKKSVSDAFARKP